MKMSEIVQQVSFLLGIPANTNVEDLQIEQAVNIAFRELKRYIRIPVEKTIPFSTRIDLKAVGIVTDTVLYVQPAYPRVGLTMGSIDSGNVFQTATSVAMYSGIGNTNSLNIEPILTQMALAQVRNTISTDLQWTFDRNNQVIYCTHREPRPAVVTVRYVPDYQDVSEVNQPTYEDYLIRMSVANMKLALGRSRSKYRIEGSNVSLDGDTLLAEANAELESIRQELESKKRKLVVLN